MSVVRKIRQQLKDLGFRGNLSRDIESLGIELTVCQFVVVVLSVISIVFLFVPLFFLQNFMFMVVFYGLSLICLSIGVWFWVKRSEICEHPEDFQE